MSALDRCLNVYDLRAAAKRRLPRAVFEFVDRGSEDGIAVANNRTAFERIKLRHRALVDVSGRTMNTTLFGKPVSMPMAIAPTGAAGLCWHEGELELAKAAAKAKIPFTLATGAMTSMEKIAKEAGPGVGGRLWFQLYVWNKREMSYQLIERAHRAGFEALIVTVDTIVPPNREYNTHNGFLLPFTPNVTFTLDIMRHPVWFTNVLMKYFTTIGMPRNENYPDEYKRMKRNDPATTQMTRQDSLCWDDIKIFRDKWPGILMVKGINRPDDAVKAIEYGVRRHRRVEPWRTEHGQRRRLDRRAAGDRRGGGRARHGHSRFRRAARVRYRQGAGAGGEGGADRARHAVRHGGRRRGRRVQGDQPDPQRAGQDDGLYRLPLAWTRSAPEFSSAAARATGCGIW